MNWLSSRGVTPSSVCSWICISVTSSSGVTSLCLLFSRSLSLSLIDVVVVCVKSEECRASAECWASATIYSCAPCDAKEISEPQWPLELMKILGRCPFPVSKSNQPWICTSCMHQCRKLGSACLSCAANIHMHSHVAPSFNFFMHASWVTNSNCILLSAKYNVHAKLANSS
jgi:hypothetical protein